VHCGGKPQCEGVRYFWLGDASPSAAFANQFNRERDYSKVSLDSQGRAVLSIEIFTAGGVAADNLAYNAGMLMVRADDFKAAMGRTSSAEPSTRTSFLRDAVRTKAFSGRPPAAGSEVLRPSGAELLKAYIDEVEAAK
jgi:hypothetical protein